jgi:hypothetical protein
VGAASKGRQLTQGPRRRTRRLVAALDREGLSSTSRAVLAMIEAAST